jgi:hypothetical protein
MGCRAVKPKLRSLSFSKSTVLELTVSALVQPPVEFSFRSVLPCPVAYDNKIDLQITPPTDARRSAAYHRKFGVRGLALAFTAPRSPRTRSNIPQLHTSPRSPLKANFPWLHQSLITNDNPNRIAILSDQRESRGLTFRSLPLKLSSLRFLIANLELELLASRTKLSSLTFSNRKKIAVFDPAPSPPICEPKKLLLSLAFGDARCRRRTAIHQHISNRNSRFTGFRSTCCKHTLYQIPNRNKNADFALFDKTNAARESHAATREPRTTTRAAFRSTIPARPHAYR